MSATVINTLSTSALEIATKRGNRVFAAYIVVLLITAIVVAFFTWWTWQSGNTVQGLIAADANARIAEAKSTAAQANERSKALESSNLSLRGQVATLEIGAANAKKDVATLQVAAAEAKAAQQKVEIDLARQTERTALAEAALLDLREKTRPRRLSEGEKVQMSGILKTLPPVAFTAFVTMEAQDGQAYLEDFKEVFDRSRWTLSPNDMGYAKFSVPIVGLLIVAHDGRSVPAQANLLVKALNAINIRPNVGFDPNLPEGTFALRIGTKQ